MRELYIVTESSGSWDDYSSWPVAAFDNKEDAERWIAAEGSKIDERNGEYTRQLNDFEEEYDKLLELGEEEFGPAFEELNAKYPKRAYAYELSNGYQLFNAQIPLNPTT